MMAARHTTSGERRSRRCCATNERCRRPRHEWTPEYARTARVEWLGGKALIRNVRNFTYRTRDGCRPAYYDSTYEIAAVRSVDLVVSRWTSEAIAHVFVSFGFADGRYLAISIETRRRRGQRYSPYAGFFPVYDLVYIVADERDLLGPLGYVSPAEAEEVYNRNLALSARAA